LKYSLIVSDFDGTLVPSDDPTLSDEVIETIDEIRKLGVKFTIATGRKFTSIYPYLKKLKINLPVILFNGAKIVDPSDGKIIHEKHFDKRTARILLSKFGTIPAVFFFDEMVFYTVFTKEIENYFKHDGIRIHHMLDDEIVEHHELTKIMIIGRKEISSAYDTLEDMEVTYFTSEKDYLEILPTDTDKGEALKVLCKHLGLKLHEVISMGDSENDDQMIESSGLGIRIDEHADALRILRNVIRSSI